MTFMNWSAETAGIGCAVAMPAWVVASARIVMLSRLNRIYVSEEDVETAFILQGLLAYVGHGFLVCCVGYYSVDLGGPGQGQCLRTMSATCTLTSG